MLHVVLSCTSISKARLIDVLTDEFCRAGPSQAIPSTRPPLPRRTNPLLLRTNLEQPPTGTSQSAARIPPRGLTILGISVLCISTYCGYLYTSYRREVAASRDLQVPEDVTDRFNATARGYDAEVDLGEKFMRLGRRRRELVRMARGDVLEVSCGTGRNMPYYRLGERWGVNDQGRAERQGCRSVTFVDLSPQMVEVAREKFRKCFPDGFERVAFWAGDAREVVPSLIIPPPPPLPPPTTTGEEKEKDGSKSSESQASTEWSLEKPYFDTVLQTMGLCSTPDPVGLLRHLGTITDPTKGRILLLEHGRSYYGWVNKILDNLAAAHANRHGCWWNRDIGRIVEESGLEVVEVKRYHLGTTWRVILRPRPSSTTEKEKREKRGDEK